MSTVFKNLLNVVNGNDDIMTAYWIRIAKAKNEKVDFEMLLNSACINPLSHRIVKILLESCNFDVSELGNFLYRSVEYKCEINAIYILQYIKTNLRLEIQDDNEYNRSLYEIVNISNVDEYSLLFNAINESFFELADLLLRCNADISNGRGGFPMLYSIIYEKAQDNNNNFEIVRIIDYLLGRGLIIDEAAANGKTALMIAVDRGDIFITNALLERNANINARNNVGDTALLIAAKSRNINMVKFLLNRGAVITTNNEGKSLYDYIRADQLR